MPDNPITLGDLEKPVNTGYKDDKKKKEVDLTEYGPAYSAALSTAIDKKESEDAASS
jgi:hypothetical protein|tara:strand:- start:110 stop:280 length:171 start_codon:yes stop_codon:yes gene_type:complete